MVIPIYVIRWSFFDLFPTTLLEMLIVTTFVLWLISKYSNRTKVIVSGKIALFIVCFIIVTIYSTLVNSDVIQSIAMWRVLFLEPILLFVVIVDVLASNNPIFKPKHIFAVLIVPTLALSVLGIVQYTLHWLIFTPDQLSRAHGVFNNGNALALFIGPIVAVMVVQLISTTIKYKIYWGLIVIIILLALILSQSLGGIIAVFATIVIFLTPFLRRNVKYIFLLILIINIVVLSNISLFTPKDVVNPWIRTGSTLNIRFCLWEGTVNLIRDKWLTGAGIRNFSQLYSQNYITCDAEALVSPHNILLNFWVEVGIIGLMIFLLILLIIFSKPINMFTSYFMVVFIHGLVDAPYFKNDLAVLFWVIFALWYIENTKLNRQNNY